jgi:hypothetical protein
MSMNSRPKSLSATELLGGGMALASVALIGLGGVHMVQPRNSLPAPKRYASVSIEPSETPAKRSIEELTDVAEVSRDVQPRDDGLAAADSIQPAHDATEGSRSPAIDRTSPLAAEWFARQRGIKADLPAAFFDVIWGLSFSDPLHESRPGDRQRYGAPGTPDARAEPTFVGGWSDGRGRCRTNRKAPLVISMHAAKTAGGECDFGYVVREAANRWRVRAICAAEGNFWRAHIALKLMEPNLTWSSERGTETYVRCAP